MTNDRRTAGRMHSRWIRRSVMAGLALLCKLSRADWENGEYSGYSGQAVKLQFRKKGTTTYKTLKTVKTNSTGGLKSTVKATVDGYYRYSFAGDTNTPAINASGDLVRVKK